MTKAAIWLRVSTGEQTTENQLAPLQEYAPPAAASRL